MCVIFHENLLITYNWHLLLEITLIHYALKLELVVVLAFFTSVDFGKNP